MTESELKRLQEDNNIYANIKKLEAKIENLGQCRRVQIFQCDPSKIENKERVFTINTGGEFYDESLAFIEKYKLHLLGSLTVLQKEFKAL